LTLHANMSIEDGGEHEYEDEVKLKSIRDEARKIFLALLSKQRAKEVEQSRTRGINADDYYNENHDSWLRGEANILVRTKNYDNVDTCNGDGNQNSQDSSSSSSLYPTQRCRYFDANGFLLMKSFCDVAEVIGMKRQMKELVETRWDPNDDSSDNTGKNKKLTVFRTDEEQINNQGSDDYFLESASKVHFFAESRAMVDEEDEGGGGSTKQRLKDEFLNDKMSALNKAGHGMHMIPGCFHEYTKSTKIRQLVQELGWTDPVVPQSMYIFKQAKVGGEVTSHQDSTFLYTTPRQSCLGLWLALDDATLENGCLWVRPGSHREKVRRKFGRNPEHFGTESIQCRSNVAKGDLTKSQMIFTTEPGSDPVSWEGKIPSGSKESVWDSLLEAGFVPVECKAGDLLVFPGELDHLSLPNYSIHQRHTFQLHLVDGGMKWDEGNWLQYPKGVPFLRLNE
jgi:phytanoyl-CoA hydroxylase